MSRSEPSDHWRSSFDSVERLRERIASVPDPQADLATRPMMAHVILAKSSSFIALLHHDGRLLDISPTALISGGLDRSEVIGLPLWMTPWWTEAEGAQAT